MAVSTLDLVLNLYQGTGTPIITGQATLVPGLMF
jgi:hypothetical protein